jgi:4-diphosphocytidyl-2-C-methyl-D-erythritol kinase
MSIAMRSFAKINLGLKIGLARADGFHQLRTVYQTLALHDVVRVEVQPGSGIEIRCNDPRVPLDATNTCYKMAEKVLATVADAGRSVSRGTADPSAPLRSARDDKNSGGAGNGAPEGAPLQNRTSNAALLRRIVIEIDKRLPVQGGMGAASSNAVAAMLGLERALGASLSPEDELRIAAEVGSDVPLFLIGGTVLGVGRGEEVYPLPDLPAQHLVVVTPPVGVSTPKAFARWDELVARNAALTALEAAGTINKFSESVFAWLSASYVPQAGSPASLELGGVTAEPASGVPARGGDRAETPLLDLVRTGIENDFERVVFPEYPELREVKRVLQREGARHASLSGSGSTLYGLFASAEEAQAAAERMSAAGHAAVATSTLTREEYWNAVAEGSN